MKSTTLKVAASAVVLGYLLAPTASWSSRAYAPVVTGTVTATPSGNTIEVDRRSYHVKPNSAAAKALNTFYVGEVVDIIVDGTPNGTNAEVVSIVQHQGA